MKIQIETNNYLEGYDLIDVESDQSHDIELKNGD